MTTGTTAATDLAVLRRRTLALLATGQILGGLGIGAAFSVGALAANKLAGASWSGMAATMSTLGAALLAVPLARLADRGGRRISLAAAALVAAGGVALCVLGMVLSSVVVLFVGLAGAGASTAASLQSRFAATDLAAPQTRGRDLSLVVWSTTVGAVIGPNLAEPGEVVGRALGLPQFAGVFVFAIVAQLAAALAYALFLRPDPLVLSRQLELSLAATTQASADQSADQPVSGQPAKDQGDLGLVRLAILATALSHATMVALMAMTPVHLVHGGATLSLVGLTLSLHIAGMFGLSPVFGILSDRLGRIPTILLGQAMLVAAALVTALGAQTHGLVMIGLTLLGLGWSASTVAGSALLSDAAPPAQRVRLQGRSDMLMSLAGAAGGALSGPMLALVGYPGLAWGLLLPIAVVVAAAMLSRPSRRWSGRTT
ncbi:putative major facilitator superfamily transporter [Microlunatus phosphovorus NM-1]|uniref:Putative major facilitator superfamily transporter n=1 Tax=Microlunatus phosphovorus (strain ATCC 700054 / DSM 10555 / JCM 9379 / NBRC 101784 / NCIMB 13414 / VKM Ac-1990 / NM-1) TaxID=1032480 RepID=F5XTM4_MICPN|nr:MFS transporter [Microlunatus phosphovorus]BAK37473.1 putative major facilitator superfamily transporter [Microlunatus phosphovorus NM-1]